MAFVFFRNVPDTLAMWVRALLTILIPPINGIVEGIDALFDEVRVLGSQFCGVKACNDADKGEVASNIVASMVLTQTPAEDMVKLCLRLW